MSTFVRVKVKDELFEILVKIFLLNLSSQGKNSGEFGSDWLCQFGHTTFNLLGLNPLI